MVVVSEPDWHNNPLDHIPETPEYSVVFRPSMGVWVLSGNRADGVAAVCSYEYGEDAWQYAQTLARRTKGVARFWSKDGKDDRRVSFEDSPAPAPDTPA